VRGDDAPIRDDTVLRERSDPVGGVKDGRVGSAQGHDANRAVPRDVRHHPLDPRIDGHQTSGDRYTRQRGQRV
jgi:hypothetical protein